MNKTSEILALLKPIKIAENINTFSELEKVIKDSPPLTFLSADFYESAMIKLPAIKVIKDGCWLLAGIWKGGGALFMKGLMEDLKIDMPLFLYDTFGNIPINNLTKHRDLIFANNFLNEANMPIEDYIENVESLFNVFGLNTNVHFIKSNINFLSVEQIPTNIALIHLDLDFYEPTYFMLSLIYDKIIQGGIIIIDDYYLGLLNCRDAVDKFFEEKGINLEHISEKFSLNSLLIKKP